MSNENGGLTREAFLDLGTAARLIGCPGADDSPP
jgi:hypothetical protein